jgi:hypothetical protein
VSIFGTSDAFRWTTKTRAKALKQFVILHAQRLFRLFPETLNVSRKKGFDCLLNYLTFLWYSTLQAISRIQITFKDKAQADEKAQHTREYVSILKRLATP